MTSHSSSAEIRVRFAPSPTGSVHLGTARAALFNWLFARGKNGVFILRIEDTDKERSKKEYEENILESLKWLGLEWDELYRQSERTEIYASHLAPMLEKGIAYRCFCSQDELEAEKDAQITAGLTPKYGGKCRSISLAESEKRSLLEPSVIRFRMPEKKVSFHDLVRGNVSFDLSLIGDIVIAKDISEPLYNFAAAVDDHEMKITHVIRGEDHISNTPKQIALSEALGFHTPRSFVHLPLILGADGKKLSKRDLVKSILDYRNEGYLPQALKNFIVLLGWHPKADREVLSMEEMIREFSFERVQKSGAVLNHEKLEWMNARYLKELSPEELIEQIRAHLPAEWFKDKEKLIRIFKIERERLRRVADLSGEISFFFKLPSYEKELLVWKDAGRESALKTLCASSGIIETVEEKDFTAPVLERVLSPLAEKEGRGEVFWPLRVALSGRKNSPGPFECAEVLGKKESLLRIASAIGELS